MALSKPLLRSSESLEVEKVLGPGSLEVDKDWDDSSSVCFPWQAWQWASSLVPKSTGLGQVLKAGHQPWNRAKSPENVGLDFSQCRCVSLLAFILNWLGTGNMAEIIIECKQDDGKPQPGWAQNSHLSVLLRGPCMQGEAWMSAAVLLHVCVMAG